MQSVLKLEATIKERAKTDKPLVNWWVYTFLLSWVTFGIYPLIVFFQRINRRDRHFRRINTLLVESIEFTREVAALKKKNVEERIRNIESQIDSEKKFFKRKGDFFCFIISLVTLGIASLWILYFLTKDWHRIQVIERDILGKLSQLWIELGILKYPIQVNVTAPNRSFALFLVLSIVTLGIWGIYWDYIIHAAPNKVYKETAQWEDALLQMARSV